MIGGFRKAEKRQAKLRLALDGPSGSGKTWTGLVTATAIAGSGRVAVIDTEHGSASLYADRFDFDVQELRGNYDPARYIEAMRDAESDGYAVILIDSLSHAWEAEGGIQEIADRNKKGGNSWSGWAAATPAYRSLIDAILMSPLHVICTMRTKTEWGVDEKNKPVKIGTAPVMRAGIDFEFTVVGDLDTEHVMRISKSRCSAVADKSYRHPGPEFGRTLLDWLEDGAPSVVEAWEQRFQETKDRIGAEKATWLLNGADPRILADDGTWVAFSAEAAKHEPQRVVVEQASTAATTGEGETTPTQGAAAPPPPTVVYEVESTSEAGVTYEVTDTGGVWACTCKGFEFSKADPRGCKHIDVVREGVAKDAA